VISRTSQKPTKTLTENPAWPEIAVLVRFNLMLSFNNRNVQLYLPELFYVISLLVATGPPLIRSSIHGLIVNLVQSLCTSMPLSESSFKRLNLLLTELSEPNFRYFFGLNNVSGNAFVVSPESIVDINDTMPLASLEKIVQALLEVMVCGAGSVDMSNTWRARWMGLVASTAFQYNPAIQPRAFVTLGCLAREEVDDDLLYQILVALTGALSCFSENECSLIISIVMCLTNIVENLQPDCRYLQQMFWLAMSLVQIGHIPLFPSAVNLLHVMLKALDSNGFFAEEDIATVLLRARRPLEEVAKKMDKEAGVNYEHFSFAVTAILLKGLKNPSTKTGTQAVLTTFLDIAAKRVRQSDLPRNIIHSSMLGYLAALLPASAKNADMKELLWQCGITDIEIDNSELGTTYYKIFEKLEMPDNQTALLLISIMVAMLQTADQEPERLFLYGFLAEAAVSLPEVFSLAYDSLLPKLIQIINNSESLPILDSVQSIMYTIVSSDHKTKIPTGISKNKLSSYLLDIGFTHLMDCGSFSAVTKEKMKINATYASNLVEKITSSRG
ncbi:6043_t:CDS:2, partial [Acaulospora colombiana]